VHVYDPSATFSFSANTAIPARARISGFHSSRDMPNQRKLDWSTWLEVGSRNLNRIASDPEKTLANFYVGGEQIVKSFSRLPQTRHDINGPPEKFCLDAFPVPHGQSMGLLVALHGQFTEGMKTFDI
jgi:nuclear RNA export factor